MNTRSTVQRQLVLETVHKLHHPTAEEVYGMIVKEHPNVSKATVYRNLNLLADIGKIRRVQLLDAAVRFDGTTSDHYHAQCRKCADVHDVMGELSFSGIGDTLGRLGFTVEDREVLIRGVCAACRQKESTSESIEKAF